jgi:D-glycero-beta-D-manno-heptose 1-phosphate adenylyltransferase
MLANHLHMSFREKIVPWAKLPAWREGVRAKGLRLVVTNGCFDILHLGHVTYLQSAREQGDLLLVGINSDSSVRELKGHGRPVNSENDRAAIVAALGCVDAACIFNERSALNFLTASKPDIWIKGGDYTIESVNQEERHAVEKTGGKVVILPLVPGKSTTTLLEKISRL